MQMKAVLLVVVGLSCVFLSDGDSVPSLDSLKVAWQNQPLVSMPIVQNFFGSATLRRDVLPSFGIISLSPITSAPFNGNFQNSTFRVNGLDTHVNTVSWTLCEAQRNATTLTINNTEEEPMDNKDVFIFNRVRMPFEQHAFMQQWDLTPSSSSSSSSSSSMNLSLFLDGPFFRSCDDPNSSAGGACGWGFTLPVDRFDFRLDTRTPPASSSSSSSPPSSSSSSINTDDDNAVAPMAKMEMKEKFRRMNAAATTSATTAATTATVMLISDTRSSTVTASAIWIEKCPSSSGCPPFTIVVDGDGGFRASVTVDLSSSSSSVIVRQSVVVSTNVDAALQQLTTSLTDFDSLFDEACTRADQRWQDAFTPRLPTSTSSSSSSSSSSYFSGSLPSLSSPSFPSLTRLYYWSELALLSLERSNLQTFPVSFVISEGPSNSFVGDAGMGGTGQFVWDLSFSALSYTLVEPDFTRHLISYVIRYSMLHQTPLLIPQAWDAYVEQTPSVGNYCFDYVSTFFLIQQFVAYTNDADSNTTLFLLTPIESMSTPGVSITPLAYLRLLAWSWTAYPSSSSSPFLRDYGSNKRDFLEAVPTYTNVIAALQLSNAGMLFALANLLEQLRDKKWITDEDDVSNSNSTDDEPAPPYSYHRVYRPHPLNDATLYFRDAARSIRLDDELAYLRGNASAIVQAVLQHQYVDGTGYFACLNSGGDPKATQVVRALSDFLYTGLSLGVMNDDDIVKSPYSLTSLLPVSVRQQMISYFMDELMGDGWVRALSLKDQVMAGVNSLTPTVEQKVAMRTDWTGTGGYGGLAGFACDTVAELEQGFESVLSLLDNLSLAARVSMPAQGVAVMTPPFMLQYLDNNDGIPPPSGPYAPNFPEFFDEPGWPPVWPSTSRSIQNAEASIADCFIRSLFGWRPSWLALSPSSPSSSSPSPSQSDSVEDVINASLWLPHVSRGDFEGVLRGVRTPFGYIDILADRNGLRWAWTRI